MSSNYPLFEARGTHRELGRQHGEQCRDRLLGLIDYLSHLLKLSRAQLQTRTVRFLPLFEKHCPHLLDEVRGLAEGAGVAFADALAVQIRGELGPIKGEACTTFVVSARGAAAGQVLIGQNSDVEPELEELAYVLRLEPIDKPALLMWTFGGQIGYHGVNDAGVAHFANSLGGGPAWRFALPHYPIKRMMLEQRTVGGVLDLLGRVPVCSSGNYVLSGGEGSGGEGRIANIELTPEGFEVMEHESCLVHTNHFVCGRHADPVNDAASVPDSARRLRRIRELVDAKRGRLTIEDLKRILADHDGHPTSICRHPHDGPDHPLVSARARTTASLIAEPGNGRLHVTRGNPCEAAYTTYEI
jgi:isopenicillin-N N-acyltransferase-like protein